jgi:endonuclease/exonuclease/phosphatase family metal-dependent hydrolase
MIIILKTIQPDILVAQEIMSPDDIGYLVQHLHLRYVKQAWHAGGMCVLSRFPITKWYVKQIPKSYYNALVLVQTNEIWVASIHLFSEQYKECEDTRRRETSWILRQVNRITRNKPCILAGDWNSPTWRHLKEKEKPIQKCSSAAEAAQSKSLTCHFRSCNPFSLPEHQLLQDGWQDAHSTNQSSTWIASRKIERIDRIYYKHLRLVDAEIIGPEHLPTKIGWPTGKDHKLVYADFL